MRDVEHVAGLRAEIRAARLGGATVGLVPTMGYLHQGHLRLVAEARRENDLVVVSIFVNPTQFGPQEDFDRYPRDLQRDRELADTCGVDLLFTPSLQEMYPDGADRQQIWVEPGPLAAHLCGASRPGHFRGVATVVAKLFNMVQPDRAYFGQKDGQQAIILSRMVRDLSFPIEIHMVPTVREPDGLALSSRNVYLSEDARRQAVALSQALTMGRQSIEAGERDAGQLEERIRDHLARAAPLGRVDYVSIADLANLQPVSGRIMGDVLVALAVYFGTTRLIDNLMVRFVDGVPSFS